MAGRAIIAPLSFNDPSLPRVDLTYISPLPNALFDWAVDSLAPGSLASWPSLVDGFPLRADAGVPQVIGSGADKRLNFDGIDDRMRTQFALAGARTVVAVYRFTAPQGLDVVHFPYNSSAGGTLGVDGNFTTLRFQGGNSKWIVPSPAMMPDDKWHVSITTMDGAASAIRVDNAEATGDLTGLPATDGLALGYSGTPGLNRCAIEYKRVAILDGGTTATVRAGLVARLKAHYNL